MAREDELLDQKQALDKELADAKEMRTLLDNKMKECQAEMKKLGKDDPKIKQWLDETKEVERLLGVLKEAERTEKLATRTQAIETTVNRVKEHVGKLQAGEKIEYKGFSGLMKRFADKVLNCVGKFLLWANKKNEQGGAHKMAKAKGDEASKQAQEKFFKEHKEGRLDPNKDKNKEPEPPTPKNPPY